MAAPQGRQHGAQIEAMAHQVSQQGIGDLSKEGPGLLQQAGIAGAAVRILGPHRLGEDADGKVKAVTVVVLQQAEPSLQLQPGDRRRAGLEQAAEGRQAGHQGGVPGAHFTTPSSRARKRGCRCSRMASATALSVRSSTTSRSSSRRRIPAPPSRATPKLIPSRSMEREIS